MKGFYDLDHATFGIESGRGEGHRNSSILLHVLDKTDWSVCLTNSVDKTRKPGYKTNSFWLGWLVIAVLYNVPCPCTHTRWKVRNTKMRNVWVLKIEVTNNVNNMIKCLNKSWKFHQFLFMVSNKWKVYRFIQIQVNMYLIMYVIKPFQHEYEYGLLYGNATAVK